MAAVEPVSGESRLIKRGGLLMWKIKNARHFSWVLVAGAASGATVFLTQPIRYVPVAEATHRGDVELGHTTTADATTEIDNDAPVGGDGRAFHVRASGLAGGVGLKAVGFGKYGIGALAYSYDQEGVYGIALPYSGTATNGVTGQSENPNANGVYGVNFGGGFGVLGESGFGGVGQRNIGVYGEGRDLGIGVYGTSTDNVGVYAVSTNDNGVYGFSSADWAGFFTSASGQAGYFNGNVEVQGNRAKHAFS